jgi:transposase
MSTTEGGGVRSIGMDVHRDFCEIAIAEGGSVRAAGRILTTPAALELFARSLAPSDEVAIEATANALAIARIIEPHVRRVVLANPKAVRETSRRAKTDKVDARVLSQLLAVGFLDEVWTPDEAARARRRLISRRCALVRQRTREKNQVHAALQRNLVERPPMSDLFGVKGRAWLAARVDRLPLDERLSVEACLRQIDFVEGELAALDKIIAADALSDPDSLRLMTLPGVSAVTAIALRGAIGDVARFKTPRQLVAYLGLDPRVRQSGNEPAKHGKISKQGPGEVRGLLVEAAWHAARAAGPLRAFHQRIAARRGVNIATVAVARKLVIIAWHLLSRGEDYAFVRPALYRQKIRRLGLMTGATRQQGKRLPEPGYLRPGDPRRRAETAFVEAQETAYRRLVADWQASRPASAEGAGATPGRASQRPSKGQRRAAGRLAPEPALRFVSRPHPPQVSQPQAPASRQLDFHP